MSIQPDTIITLRDVFDTKEVCVTGIRQWLDAHDIDFREFAKNGISVGSLNKIAPDDPFVIKVIKLKQGLV